MMPSVRQTASNSQSAWRCKAAYVTIRKESNNGERTVRPIDRADQYLAHQLPRPALSQRRTRQGEWPQRQCRSMPRKAEAARRVLGTNRQPGQRLNPRVVLILFEWMDATCQLFAERGWILDKIATYFETHCMHDCMATVQHLAIPRDQAADNFRRQQEVLGGLDDGQRQQPSKPSLRSRSLRTRVRSTAAARRACWNRSPGSFCEKRGSHKACEYSMSEVGRAKSRCSSRSSLVNPEM